MDTSTLDHLARFGLPTLILFAAGWAAWKSCAYLGRRLFDAETGLITLAAGRVVQLIDHLQTVTDRLAQSQETITAGLTGHYKAAESGLAALDAHGTILDGLRDAGRHACDLLAAVESQLHAAGLPTVTFAPYLDRIRQALDQAAQ